MTTYNELAGLRVNYLGSDPTLNTGNEGQVWYNSTSGTLKSLVQIKAWSAGSNMGTARVYLAGCGTQTAGLGFGGVVPTPANSNATEEYSGYTWATGGNMNTARQKLGGAGIQTAGLAIGGKTTVSVNSTEEYDGSAWTAGGNLGTARYAVAGAGIQTAGLGFGGDTGPGAGLNSTEEYDGSSWTAGGNLGTARYGAAGAGTQTVGLGFGGGPLTPPVSTATEEYNGTSWTAGGSLNTGRRYLAGAGVQTSAIGFGGATPTATGATEEYDGSVWVSSTSMTTARRNLGGAGTRSAALGFGGTPPITAATEEFNSSINAITNAAWSSGGNLPTAKRGMASSGAGNINSSLIFGGDNLPMGAGQPQVNTTEEYNGSAWTAGGNLGNNLSGSAGAGTQIAAIGASGYSFPTPWSTAGASYIDRAFEYDGSSWTNVTALPASRVGSSAQGTQTAATFQGGAVGGNPGPEADQRSLNTVNYDGTNWTTSGNLNSGHGRTQASAGTQTAGIVFGGGTIPGPNGDALESFNGSTWTSEPPGLVVSQGAGGFGTQSLFVWAGGTNSGIPASPGTTGYNIGTFEFNGTSVSSTANTASNHMYTSGDGTVGTASGFIAGGSNSYTSNTTATEEYTQGTSATTASTLTTS